MPTADELNDVADPPRPEIDSKYRLIILAAKRSKQLQRGARPRIDIDPTKHKFTRIALEEVIQGKVNFFSTTERGVEFSQGLLGDLVSGTATGLQGDQTIGFRASGLEGDPQTRTGSKPKSK